MPWNDEARKSETWRDFLAGKPFTLAWYHEQLKESKGPGTTAVLDAIEAAPNREEKLAVLRIAAYVWDGDEGYGCLPNLDFD